MKLMVKAMTKAISFKVKKFLAKKLTILLDKAAKSILAKGDGSALADFMLLSFSAASIAANCLAANSSFSISCCLKMDSLKKPLTFNNQEIIYDLTGLASTASASALASPPPGSPSSPSGTTEKDTQIKHEADFPKLQNICHAECNT